VARDTKSQHPDLVEELDSIADRGAEWVRANLVLTITILVVVLVAAASFGFLASYKTRSAEAASDALDQVASAYMAAMGANPGDLAVPELANPTAAEGIRSEYAAQFSAVAAEHSGTTAGALARLEEGNLSAAAGDLESATQIWQEGLAELDDNPNLRAVFLQRIGHANEEAERWLEAGEAHESASAIDSYPLRFWAMASAAYCFAQADERERARELALRLSQLAPDLELPDYWSGLLAELQQNRAS